VTAVRVTAGHPARLVNLSSHGALIETGGRLLPGARIELQLARQGRSIGARGVVMRCNITGLCAGDVTYRGAVRFDDELSWFAVAAAR
jgi:hypothetical protein